MASSAPETAVRNYLTFLSDPDGLVDRSAIEKLEDAAESAKDPIDKLMSITRLIQAKSPDPDTYRQGFVEHAREWAEAEGVPASSFEHMGVPRDVLREAGLIAKVRSGRGRRSREATTSPRPRRPSMKSGQLEEGILALDEPFSVRDVADKVGGSPVTIKAAVERLEAQRKIVPAGERAGGRGRASKVWTVAVEAR